MSKVISVEQCLDLIKDGDTVAWTTAGLAGFSEYVAEALGKTFFGNGQTADLVAVHSCGCGDGKTRGMNHLGNEGMVKRLIAGHIGEAPRMANWFLKTK